jgi:hypothetical protein
LLLLLFECDMFYQALFPLNHCFHSSWHSHDIMQVNQWIGLLWWTKVTFCCPVNACLFYSWLCIMLTDNSNLQAHNSMQHVCCELADLPFPQCGTKNKSGYCLPFSFKEFVCAKLSHLKHNCLPVWMSPTSLTCWKYLKSHTVQSIFLVIHPGVRNAFTLRILFFFLS